MPNIGIGVWTVNAERLPNASVSTRLNNLRNMITLAFRQVTADVHVFVGTEFYFCNANIGESGIRWYTEDERNEVLRGLADISRMKSRFLLVGGSICWYKTRKSLFGPRRFEIFNETPVYYNGTQLKLHRKRVPGGEKVAHDTLRVAEALGEVLDRMITTKSFSADNQPFWRTTKHLGTLEQLVGERNSTYRTPEDERKSSMPDIGRLFDKYDTRIDYIAGTGEGSFSLPNSTFTGGVEVCMEHSMGTFEQTSALGATNFHIVTANTVTCHASERGQTDHTNIADPGIFIHCSAGDAWPTVVTKTGGARTLENGWLDVADLCKVIEVPMPPGL